MEKLKEELAQLENLGLRRTLSTFQPTLDLTSNDYLGLAHDESIRSGLIEALKQGIALGATGSRLLGGNSKIHMEVEEYLAKAFGAERALLFSSGYAANISVLTALSDTESEVFSDELNHASLIDGIRAARMNYRVFRHNDLHHLRELLENSSAVRKVIVSESVFSMDGDLAPLTELYQISLEHNAWLVIDEAHATGVFGREGLGRTAGLEKASGLEGKIFADAQKLVVIHTAGKALGAQGAFVTSGQEFYDLLIQKGRAFVFSTGLSPLTAVQIQLAVVKVRENPGWGEELLAKARRLRERIEAQLHRHYQGQASGSVRVGNSESQILPILVPGNARVLAVANKLRAQGFGVCAVRSPTVPPNQERLRVSLKRVHTDEQLQAFAEALCACL